MMLIAKTNLFLCCVVFCVIIKIGYGVKVAVIGRIVLYFLGNVAEWDFEKKYNNAKILETVLYF